MDPAGFEKIVDNFTNLTPEESKLAEELARSYPYSQILHFLEARAASDLKLPNSDALLHQSAVYATDRRVLKWVMTAPKKERTIRQQVVTVTPAPEIAPAEKVTAVVASVIIEESKPGVTLSGDALRQDLFEELKKLQILKHNFELSVEAFEGGKITSPVSEKKTKLHGASKEAPADPLIEEIKQTRKKIKAENPKQKEQNEIIDQFIKAQPAIPRASSQEPAKDLSEDSGMFGDHIVSETLVDILLKQGKKDKAIEVLKKLIWKFPQKKAYFAAQIQSLKS